MQCLLLLWFLRQRWTYGLRERNHSEGQASSSAFTYLPSTTNRCCIGTRFLSLRRMAVAFRLRHEFYCECCPGGGSCLRPWGILYIPSMSGDGTVILRGHASHGEYTMLRAKFVHFVTVPSTPGVAGQQVYHYTTAALSLSLGAN